MKSLIDLSEFDAVIFDMDGTMIDNTPYHRKAWQEFFKLKGRILTDEEYNKNFSGKKNENILPSMFEGITNEEILQYGTEKEQLYRDLYAPYLMPLAGLRDTIALLEEKHKKLAIATTSNAANREFVLETLNLKEHFPIVVGDTDVTEGKPNPEIYLITAKKLEVEPSKCLVFEDSPPGVAAGKKAGMTVVAVMTAHTDEELKSADFQIKDFTELKFEN
jgi:beta-phosphoglucomutase family hydrolase